MTHITHLYAKGNGFAVECNTPRAKFAMRFSEFHANHKANGESSCKRCEAAYKRRLEAAMAKKAGA